MICQPSTTDPSGSRSFPASLRRSALAGVLALAGLAAASPKAAAQDVTWNFATATPTANGVTGLTVSPVTTLQTLGTTAMITSSSVSSGYTGATGTFNAGAPTKTGALAPATSTAFEVTLTPPAGSQVTLTGISFGTRSTGTGPQAYAIRSNAETTPYTTDIATGTIANNSSWSLKSHSGLTASSTTGAVTFRIYGYNGSGSAGSGTINWRIDDLKLTVSLTGTGPDTTPPTVTTLSPASGATGVEVDTSLTVTFSEPIAVGTGNITVFTSAGAVVGTPINVTTLVPEGNSLTFSPSVPLNVSTSYYVQIAPTAIDDAAGNSFAGITDTTTWTFATVGPDLGGPVPVGYDPAQGSNTAPAGVPLEAAVEFDEDIVITETAVISLLDADNGDAVIETLDIAAFEAIASDNIAFLQFSTAPVGGHNYKIRFSAGAVTDLTATANPNAEFSWSFSTFDLSGLKVAINKFSSTDVVELLVIGDGPGTTLDMRGMVLKDHSGDTGNDNGGGYTFSNDALWSAVPAGTLVVLTKGTASSNTVDTATPFVIKAFMGSSTYMPVISGSGTFDISANDMVQIKAAGSARAGSVGAIHTLSAGVGTQYQNSPPPKVALGSGNGEVYVKNENASVEDFNAGPGGAASGSKTYGEPNTTGNATYINYLRGLNGVTVEIADASLIVDETAPEQLDAITITLPAVATANTTVNLSVSPAGSVLLPASVVVEAGASTAVASFTPVSDGVIVGNRTVTITATVAGMDPDGAQVTLVEGQYIDPPVVINKYVNGTPDAVELLVIQNNADLRGMIIKDFSGNMGTDNGGGYTFSTNALWSSVPSGTLIVLTNDNDPENVAVEDFDAGDFVLRVRLRNTTYFANTPANTNGSFDIANGDLVMLKAAGSPVAGVTGNIHTLAGGFTIGNFFKLTAAPKAVSDITEGGGPGVYIANATSTLADFNGVAVGNVSLASLLGLPNNETNQAYIESLRGAVSVPGYGSWATANVGGAAANVDTDGDGVLNGIEYFYGATGSGFTPSPTVVGGAITWPKGASVPGSYGTAFYVQTSATLEAGSWTTVPAGNANLSVTSSGVTYTLPAGSGKIFARLVVVP